MIICGDQCRLQMDNHVDSVQSDLDSLKELLRSEGLSLDANTLLGVSIGIDTNPQLGGVSIIVIIIKLV